MPQCRRYPLSASADTAAWSHDRLPGPGGSSGPGTPLYPTSLSSMGTLCSQSCGGSSVSKLGYRALETAAIIACIVCGRALAAVFAVLYGASECCKVSSPTEATRAVLSLAVACTAAGASKLSFIVWLAFMAAFVHIIRVALFLELELLADCARCCNEAHWCKCGRAKKPIPPGTLAHLATVVQQRWRERIAVHANTCKL